MLCVSICHVLDPCASSLGVLHMVAQMYEHTWRHVCADWLPHIRMGPLPVSGWFRFYMSTYTHNHLVHTYVVHYCWCRFTIYLYAALKMKWWHVRACSANRDFRQSHAVSPHVPRLHQTSPSHLHPAVYSTAFILRKNLKHISIRDSRNWIQDQTDPSYICGLEAVRAMLGIQHLAQCCGCLQLHLSSPAPVEILPHNRGQKMTSKWVASYPCIRFCDSVKISSPYWHHVSMHMAIMCVIRLCTVFNYFD